VVKDKNDLPPITLRVTAFSEALEEPPQIEDQTQFWDDSW
jgi:hypothetical protein